jgi:hypothetical protein
MRWPSSAFLAFGATGLNLLLLAQPDHSIGAGVGVAAAVVDHPSASREEAYRQGKAEGTKAGERPAQTK